MSVALGLDLRAGRARLALLEAPREPVLLADPADPAVFEQLTTVARDGAGFLAGAAAAAAGDLDPDLPRVPDVAAALARAGSTLHDAEGRSWPATALAAVLLRKWKRDVEAQGGRIERCALALPADAPGLVRRAWATAAAAADLPVFRVVDRAVALACSGLERERVAAPRTDLVFALDGEGFEAAVVRVEGGAPRVLAREVHAEWSTRQVTERLAARLGGPEAGAPASPEALEGLRARLDAPGALHARLGLVRLGRMEEHVVLRHDAALARRELVEQGLTSLAACLRAAGLTGAAIGRVVLAGDGCRSAAVASRVAAFSGLHEAQVAARQPAAAAAFGAALWAAAEPAAPADEVETGRLPVDLGLRTRDPETGKPGLRVILRRGAELPARRAVTLYNGREDQARMVLEILRSAEGPEHSERIGVITYGPIEPPRAHRPLEVQLSCDRAGRLELVVRDVRSESAVRHDLDDPVLAGLLGVEGWRAAVRQARIND